MVEGEATQEPIAPEDAPTSPPDETLAESVPGETSDGEWPATASDETPSAEIAAADAQASVSGETTSPEASFGDAPHEASPESAGEARPAFDWSHLRGFQTVEPPGEAEAAREDYAEELSKELATRAARFARSVDESIVISSDGLMRWLGDPVARLVSGEALLAPHAVPLADEALAGDDRAAVENRIALWLTAHVRKVLGPLVSLADGTELGDAAKALGAKIAEALGVLERDRVRAEVKALDQNARGALRKLGVRFGSQYIYVPALLKPGPRGLCSLLWTLRRGAEAGADRLLAFASAGRTSFANEGLLSPDAYRVAGFRLCGERVVRVDIIERLSDLIRAAMPDHMRFGSRPPSDAYGFLVTPQMTSLTGCSGEAFASILRSLGFEAVTVSKAAFEAANRKASTEPIKPATAGGESAPLAEAPAPEEAPTEAATDDETLAVAATDPEQASGTIEPEDASGEAAGHADHIGSEAEAVTTPSGREAATAETEAQAETSDEPVVDPVASEPHQEEVVAAAETERAGSGGETEAQTDPAESIIAEAVVDEHEGDAATITAPSVPDHASPTEAGATATPAEMDEEIEIWRPAPRRPRAPQRPPAAEREGRPHHGKPRDHRRHGRQPEPDKPAETPVAAQSAETAAPHSQQAPTRNGKPERRDEAPRWREAKGKEDGRGRDDRKSGKDFGSRRDSRPAQVDPDSPFAKLAALKPLLERRDKRT